METLYIMFGLICWLYAGLTIAIKPAEMENKILWLLTAALFGMGVLFVGHGLVGFSRSLMAD